MAPGDGYGDGGCGCGDLFLLGDIILEVLLRLPAKALGRFRCVCKAWHAVISNPAFVAAQRSRATGPFIVAVFGSASEHELRLLDMGGNVLRAFDVARGGTALLASTRLDLVCVDRAELGATVINPGSGRDLAVLSAMDRQPTGWWALTLMMSMEASSEYTFDYSFDRAAVSGDYKVLRLVTWSSWDIHTRCCEVATVTDGGAKPTWRQRRYGPFLDGSFSCEDKVTVNGTLYFMPYGPYYNWPAARDCIAAFDLDSEEWKPEMIKCPPLEHMEEEVWRIVLLLTELKGTLCVVQNNLTSWGGHYANLWLLMDANKSTWVREYRIQIPGQSLLLYTKPLDVTGDGTILLLLNVSSKAGNAKSYFLQFYNSSTENFTDFMGTADGFNGTMAIYTGSLLS